MRSDKHKFRFKVLKMLNGVKSQQCCLSWETVAKGWPNRFCSIHYGLRARAHGTDDRYSITQVLFKNTLTNARNSIYPYLVSGHFPGKLICYTVRRRIGVYLEAAQARTPHKNWEKPMHLSVFTTFCLPQNVCLPLQYFWQIYVRAP